VVRRFLLVLLTILGNSNAHPYECSGELGHYNSCCTADRLCGLGQGDCDQDDECEEGLICGRNNCIDFNPDASRYSDCCIAAPTTTATLTTTTTNINANNNPTVGSLACGEFNVCQENALCFLDEVHKINTGGEDKSDCVCKLGYVSITGVNASDEIYPKTGTCVPLTSENACLYPETCLKNADGQIICPYCKAHYENSALDSIGIGSYISGTGSMSLADPMLFDMEDDTDCSSVGYWYCWYDLHTMPLVPLNMFDVRWISTDDCNHRAYIYTPMACQFAQPFT